MTTAIEPTTPTPPRNQVSGRLRPAWRREYGIQLLVLIVVLVLVLITTPGFGPEAVLFSTLNGFTLVGITALGVGVTMIAGELDLSVGSMAAVAAVLTIQFESIGLFGAIALATAAAAAFGAVQGWLIARLRINSLVFTVATLILLRGLAYIFSGEGPIALTDYTLSDPFLGRFTILSGPINVAILVFVAIGLFLAFTRWGREIYAIGGARQEATTAGVPVRRAITVAFALSGGCAGLAGAMSAMRGASATPAAFDGLLLTAVAAALIGGISLSGGRGGVLNVALGVAIVSLVSAGLAVRGEQSYVVQLATGALLFLVITLEFVARRIADRPTALLTPSTKP